MVTRPSWIANLPVARPLPFRGLGAADLVSRKVVSMDGESIRMPDVTLKSAGGQPTKYMRRKIPPAASMQFAASGHAPPQVLLDAERIGWAVIEYTDELTWRAVVVGRRWIKRVTRRFLKDDYVIVGHNTSFDLGIAANGDYKTVLMVYKALAEGRIVDTMIREMLLVIASGRLQDDDTHFSFNLAELTAKYLMKDRSADKKGDDIWRLRYHELYNVKPGKWPRKALQYALDDASDTLLVAFAQAPVGDPTEIKRSFAGYPLTTLRGGVNNEIPQMRAAWALHLQGLWGMRVDGELHTEWGKEIDVVVTRAETIARAAGFLRADGTTSKKMLQSMVEADFLRRGVPAEEVPRTDASKKFPDGQIKTDKETLLQCTATEISVVLDGKVQTVQPLKEWGEAGFMRKMRSTYYNVAQLGISASLLWELNVLVATGRTSCRKPNMQNPPRDGLFRELFIARPGMVLCSTDYASLEMRTLAQLHYWWFGHSVLRAAFLRGEDPHVIFGAELAGVTIEVFKSWKATAYAKFKMYRQLAKALNFGAPGGLGAEKLISYAYTTYGVDMYASAVMSGFAEEVPGDPNQRAVQEARHAIAVRFTKHLIRKWKDLWVEARMYMDAVGMETEGGQKFVYVHPVSYRQRGGCSYTSGNNTGFQGLAADGAKESAWRMAVLTILTPADALEVFRLQEGLEGASLWPEGTEQEEVRAWGEALQGVRALLFIHDEIMSEGPEATSHIWAPAQATLLERTMEIYTPDVPQVVEPALMRRWYKAAEAVYSDDGRLIPWEPKA